MKTIKIKPDFIKGIPDGPYCVVFDERCDVSRYMLCSFFRRSELNDWDGLDSQKYLHCDLFSVDLTAIDVVGPDKIINHVAYKNWQCIEAGKAAEADPNLQ